MECTGTIKGCVVQYTNAKHSVSLLLHSTNVIIHRANKLQLWCQNCNTSTLCLDKKGPLELHQ